ncbi:MAG: AAA family ATPase [Candidatus Rokuibacteriota bacterium]
MIRLDRVELLHWDIQPHQVLPLAPGITLLTGENGSGKSAILDGIKVALGVTRLGGDRDIEKYLNKQARPVAMVRVVADNRPLAGTRQRPFDRLGEFASDLVTLAVVFRAQDEAKYVHEYYLLDGDVVPPLDGGRRTLRPLPGPTDYRQRLSKVGITDRYLKLLSLAQGQIASLCKRDPNALFDDLYDIIGGRQTLEAWEARLKELRDAQEQHDSVQKDLDNARIRLQALAARVRRHEDWRQVEARRGAAAAALPHVELREARARSERLADQVKRLASEIDAIQEEISLAADRARAASDKRDERSRRKEALKLEVKELGGLRDEVKEAAASARAEFTELDKLREKGERVAWDDIERLERESHALRTDRAVLAAESAGRQTVRRQAEKDLAQVNAGILPLPEEVERFRARLKNEGIAHHFLHEVVDVQDAEWQPALEGYLGRYRFAVLVRDLASWSRAAELARDQRYPHGVLAPDVRGHSPLDESSIFRRLHVQDPDYRALVARLLRPVVDGEPAVPLEPTRRGELLSRTGFVVSRIEARHAHAEMIYLGREALRRRATELEAQLAALDEADGTARQKDEGLRAALARLDEQIEAQRARRAWETVRDRHAELRARVQELDEEHKRRGAEIEQRQTEIDGIDLELAALQTEIGSQTQKEKDAQDACAKKTNERQETEAELSNAAIALGKLLAMPPPEADAAVRAVLEEGSSLLTLRAQLAELTGRTADFTDDERDPMLPVNHQRQTQEVTAVEERLTKLAESVEKTREAADRAHHDYQRMTRLIFRDYFARLRRDAEQLGFRVDGELVNADNGRFRCEVRVGIDQKSPVHYASPDLSGGQKAALSILMAMTAVSLESDGAGFFLVDEPFSASDVYKINELGDFLARTKAQYLVSMPTSSDVAQCGEWLSATWISTKSPGGFDGAGRPVVAPRVKLNFSNGTRDGW